VVAGARAGLRRGLAGFEVHTHAWGVARQEDKIRALQALGARVLETTEEAVTAALAH
jgi:hypothetical protein